MGKKDLNKGSNIDMYRKRIGKQSYQMNKKMVRSLKDVADAKQSSLGIKDVVLVLITILVLLVAIYSMFYFGFDVEV